MHYAVSGKTSSSTRPWDVTLAQGFTVAALLYTLTDHMSSRGDGNVNVGEKTELARKKKQLAK